MTNPDSAIVLTSTPEPFTLMQMQIIRCLRSIFRGLMSVIGQRLYMLRNLYRTIFSQIHGSRLCDVSFLFIMVIVFSANVARAADFSPYTYGAKGDGIADDTVACNKAADAAHFGKGNLIFPTGIFGVSDYIIVRAGVQSVLGTGGIIKYINANSGTTALLLPSGHFSASLPRSSRMRISGLQIDCSLIPPNLAEKSERVTYGIYAQNASNLDVVNNRIYNMRSGVGILIRGFIGGESVTGNVLDNNRIEGDTSISPVSEGVQVDVSIVVDPPYNGDAIETWRNTFTALHSPISAHHNTISNNTIIGGYYGFSMSTGQNNIIFKNTISQNVRNLSLQNNSNNNVISWNKFSSSQFFIQHYTKI